MSEKFKVAALDEMEFPASTPGGSWSAIRHHLGVTSFGINAWSAPKGSQVISEHVEDGPRSPRHEELYLVLSGRATFTVDGETIDAPTGTVVFVADPGVKRGAVAAEDDTTVLAVGGRPGEAFTPSNWERSAPALSYFATKEYDKAHQHLTKVQEENPGDPTVLYNLACAESLLGRPDEAIEHLRESIAGDDSFRDLATTDTDFDAIRSDSRFVELLG